MDNIDIIIENTVKNKIYEPYGYEQAILTALDNKRSLKINTFIMAVIKTIVTLFTGVIITLSAVFAKDIYNWVYRLFNPETTSKGIIDMVEDGYIYNTEMDYIESNGVYAKIEHITMDDYNLDIIFNIKSKNNIEHLTSIAIPDLIITDENNNILFCNNIKKYEKFCQDNNLEYSNKNMDNNFTNEGYSIELIEKDDKNIKFIYRMFSSQYPNSKMLNVNFETINCLVNNEISDELKGNWDIKIELPENLYNRHSIVYTQQTGENEIKVESAKASNAEMRVIFEMKNMTKKIDVEGKSIEERMKTMDELLDEIISEESIDEITLENEEGKVYYISQTSREGSFSKVHKSNGNIEVNATFSIKRKELTNNMKMKIKKGNKNIILNLVNKEYEL